MTSLFKTIKFDLETMFSANWSATPIHFAGQEFDGTSIDKWINPFYAPTYNTLGILTDRLYGNLNVACWANTDVDVMELSDDVVTFINDNLDKTKYRIKNFEMADHGWQDSNKVYTLMLFTIETLTC